MPLYNGAIGMTYEQQWPRRPRCVDQPRRHVPGLSHPEPPRIRPETVEESVRRAGELVENTAYHRRNIESPFGAYRGYVFPAGRDAAKMAELRRLLDANGID